MMKMSKKMVMDELVKALRCCERYNCRGCPFMTVHKCSGKMIKQAADTLESFSAERDGLKEQLASALSENTKQPNEPLTNFDYITASLENLINTIELSRSCKTCPASASCKITTGEMTCHQARLAWLNQPYVRPPEAGEKK